MRSWQLLLVAVCLNLAVIAIYYYLYTQVQQKNQNIAELKANIEDLTAQKESLKLARDNISETALLQKEIDNYIIPKDGLVKFLNLLETLGSENRLVSSVSTVVMSDSPVNPDIFQFLNVELEVFGSWADVYHFAALIELLPYKVSVSVMKLEKISSDVIKVTTGNQKQISTAGRPWKGTFSLKILKFI